MGKVLLGARGTGLLSGIVATFPLTIQEAVVTLSAADVLALTDSTGVELAPARPNTYYFPLLYQATKQPGAAFTTGTSATLALGYLGLDHIIDINHTGFTDQTALITKYRTHASITAAGDNPATYLGKALGVVTTTGTFTGTGSPITVRVLYYLVQVP
jgi:hypothetical protein